MFSTSFVRPPCCIRSLAARFAHAADRVVSRLPFVWRRQPGKRWSWPPGLWRRRSSICSTSARANLVSLRFVLPASRHCCSPRCWSPAAWPRRSNSAAQGWIAFAIVLVLVYDGVSFTISTSRAPVVMNAFIRRLPRGCRRTCRLTLRGLHANERRAFLLQPVCHLSLGQRLARRFPADCLRRAAAHAPIYAALFPFEFEEDTRSPFAGTWDPAGHRSPLCAT